MDAMPGWRGREQLLDAVLGLAVTALAVASVLTPDPAVAYDFRDPTASAVLLAFAAGLPLTVRRRWPLAVSVTVTAAVTTLAALRFGAGQTPLCQMFGLYAVAAYRSHRAALVALGTTYAGMGLLVLLGVPYFDRPLAAVSFVGVTVAWIIGRLTRRWRSERDAARARVLAAERAGAVAAERAVFADRLRIARDLHDVVSHTLTVIAVQAGSTRYLLGATNGPLATIEQASRAALDDLRRMLGLLRADTSVPGPTPPRPRPVQRQIDERVVDAAIALALVALGLANVFVRDPSIAYHYADPSAGLAALVLVSCLPLAARRAAPVAAFVVSAGAVLLLTLLNARTDVPGLAMFVALYTVAAWRRFSVATICLAVLLSGEILTIVFDAPGTDGLGDLAGAGALIPWGLGLIVRRWRRDRDTAVDREAEAHRHAAVEAQRAVFAERIRIAAELQDVVAHTLSEIAVQSAVARHQAGATGPGAPALAAIEEASRSALDDVRRMLGILHADAPLTPNPGIEELELLVAAHRQAHGPVSLTIDDAVRTTPASVQVTAYRLIQEALTNVRKHAPGAAAHIRVSRAGDEVHVQVDDDGPSTGTAGSSGFGITGMRERVALFNGRLDTGSRAGGGFRVQAVLCLDADRTVTT